jgi:hypothetical protein
MAFGAVIGATLGVALYAVCNIAGIAITRRVAVAGWTGLIGFVGPMIADRLMTAHPRWFDVGFDEDDAGQPPG